MGGVDVVLPDTDALYEGAACGLIVTRPDGMVLRANRTFCKWLGFSADEIEHQRRLQDLMTMGGRIFHHTHWAPLLLLQRSVAEVKLDLIHQDGHVIPMFLNAVVREHEGACFHDVSAVIATDRNRYERELLRERHRAEELLAQQLAAQEALAAAHAELAEQRQAAEERALFAEQMIGIMSHDLRNPLWAIQMSTNLLRRGELTAHQQQVVGRIDTATVRANRMIEDVLDSAKARLTRSLAVQRVPLDLHDLVAGCVEEARAAFPERMIRHGATGEGPCCADGAWLATLVGNLIANAVAYGDPAGGVDVASRLEGDCFSLSVHNTGEPIEPSVLRTLFTPVSRPAASGLRRSVGLGLFIVRLIAQAHGGEVTVVSNREEGTVFKATMPRL